jgi:MSHA type pilus biogenesis protein MshL
MHRRPGAARAAGFVPAVAAMHCVALVVVALLNGCAQIRPYVPPSPGHIAAPATAAPKGDIPSPARLAPYVPPPRAHAKLPVYTVVVNEVPVKELLQALARDTRQNIDIHPSLQGTVSINAIDETLPAILDRMSRQVNMRYRQEGGTIIVTPDTPYMKTYRIGYVNMTRDTVSSIGVTGEIASSGSGGSGGQSAAIAPSGGSLASSTSGSNTVVRTVSRNDFWEQLRENIRSILSSTRNQMLSAEDKAARLETVKAAREERLLQAEAVARAGQAATALFTTAFGAPQQPVLGDAKDDVVVNAVSGTVSVLGTERQHELIRQHIESITQSVQRQVLIEATIVEVTLSDAYQGGIDWSRLAVSGGIAFNQRLLGGFDAAAQLAGASAGNAITLGYQNPASSVGNISATVKLLQEFGNTRVLSSPKLMALNNQTALLKVVDNVVYFEIHAQTNTTQGVATTTFNSTPKIVAVGVVMGVTPQVANDKRVSLTVRPTISRVLRFKEDPNPSLTVNGQRIPNPVPEIQVREMESVLQVASGQTVILGGLMQDDMRFIREQLPVLGDARDIGELFRFRNERVAKTELVIFLKPTVITNPTLDSDELKFFQRFLPDTLGEAAGTGGIR